MLFSVSLLFLSAAVAIFLFRLISQYKVSSLHELSKSRLELRRRYDYMMSRKFELLQELHEKRKQLETLINNQDGMRIKTAAQIDISEEDAAERVSTFLLASGKITLEQDHKIRKEMPVLKMDYLSVGVTLGYIDLTVSEQLSRNTWNSAR